MTEFEEELIQVENHGSDVNKHCTTFILPIAKGKSKGTEKLHFKCNYCSKLYVGPSNSSIASHLKKEHASRCPDLLENSSQKPKPARAFFDKMKAKLPFDENVFLGKLLKWIIRTDQPFSILDNEDFGEMMDYLKTNITLVSRRTLMRRLDELYEERKEALKQELSNVSSKISMTCDVWTFLNQLSFFGFTIHFIDADWQMHQRLLSFKYLVTAHDGENLARAMIEVVQDFGIADRLLGVTLDNASNNTAMLRHVQLHYDEHYQDSGFSVAWNQIECVAHVLNLAAAEILKNFRQPVDADDYDHAADSADNMVTAVSRLAYLCRRIRNRQSFAA